MLSFNSNFIYFTFICDIPYSSLVVYSLVYFIPTICSTIFLLFLHIHTPLKGRIIHGGHDHSRKLEVSFHFTSSLPIIERSSPCTCNIFSVSFTRFVSSRLLRSVYTIFLLFFISALYSSK